MADQFKMDINNYSCITYDTFNKFIFTTFKLYVKYYLYFNQIINIQTGLLQINMTPVIILRHKLHLNRSSLSANMIYNNNDLHEQEEKPITSRNPMLECLNVYDQIHITISNVSSSFNLKSHLNLRNLALRGNNVEYRREKGVIYFDIIYNLFYFSNFGFNTFL